MIDLEKQKAILWEHFQDAIAAEEQLITAIGKFQDCLAIDGLDGSNLSEEDAKAYEELNLAITHNINFLQRQILVRYGNLLFV